MTHPQHIGAGAVAVIPCLNEREHIAELIATLLADPEWVDPLVVVADGGSTDGSREIVTQIAMSDPRVRLLNNSKRLQSAGMNLALRTFGAGYRWAVRVDAHAVYPLGYVSALVRAAERAEADSVVVSMVSRGTEPFQKGAAIAQNSRLGTGGSAHRLAGDAAFVEHGHHALWDIEHFLAVGGYDETFSHNEDAEFDIRFRKNGGRIWLTRDVEIVYFPRSKPSALFRQYLSYGRGRARTLLRHRERPRVRQVLPLGVAPALAILPLAVFWAPAAAPALSWAAICLAYGAVLSVRGSGPAALLAGPAAMIMHAGWSLGFWQGILSHRSGGGPVVAKVSDSPVVANDR